MTFSEPPQGLTFPELEEQILQYWKENSIFEKSVSNRTNCPKWTFLDGPPFITGMPHYGSLLPSISKDVFPRYWTMKGYKVERVWGWDCHGLPAENKVENELGIKTKSEIETVVGVKKFIDSCKAYVSRVSAEWEWYIDHIGRWVDFKNAYRTMDTNYMESVMWVFKQMYDKGFIYKGLRVSLFCPHCSTSISNFEVSMDGEENYKLVKEKANTYKYELESEKGTYFLAWSTTPWNKIVTPALAVNPKFDYVKVKQGNEKYILAETTLKMLKDEPYEVIARIKGSDLVGMKFVGHYDFYKIDEGKKAFVIIGGDFVTADEGTGIVTIAAYGEDDLSVMKENNIQVTLHVNETGHLINSVPNWGGMYYLKVNELVNEDLSQRGLVYREDDHEHRVPHCWRCHTRLMHSPQNAWFVDIQKLKPLMEKTNKKVNWYPKHFKMGRFLKSLQAAPDWCISRSRYWGSPVPVWECEKCNARIVPGSIAELEELSGEKINDLHKPEIDELIIKCADCGGQARRVKEVLDSWIEAGSASFAERHYPFDGLEKLSDFFPPDFIIEYTGQIRAWFYVLHVIGAALHESQAFKNVMVTGVLLGSDGRKMSKNYGNYPDPKQMLTTHGADSFRLYMLGSVIMNGEDLSINETDWRNWVKSYMLILFNSYKYFLTYANLNKFEPESGELNLDNVLDRWIYARWCLTHAQVQYSLEAFNTTTAVSVMNKFVSDLSTWYIRRSRERINGDDETDKKNFLSTLYKILVNFCYTSAPITPFISDYIYRTLTGNDSVHLEEWPAIDYEHMDEYFQSQMDLVRQIVEKGHSERKQVNIPVRQPLSKLTIKTNSDVLNEELEKIIRDELNVKKITWEKIESNNIEVELDTNVDENLKAEGETRDIIRQIQVARKEAKCALDEIIDVELATWPNKFEDQIKKNAKIRNLLKGDKLKVIRIA